MIRGAKLTGNLHVLAQSRRSSLRLEHSSIRPTPTWSPSPSCQLGHVRRSFASSSVSRAPEPVASSVASISSSADSALSILDPLLPILHSIPSYLPSTLVGAYPHTISLILLTIAVRASFTLPATLWQRARTARMNNLVVPEWQAWKARLPPKVARQCKREKKSYAEYKEELQKQVSSSVPLHHAVFSL